MVIAALICFALLLAAWIAAPTRAVRVTPMEHDRPAEAAEDARGVMAAA
jgi:hypothetical protein